MYHVDSCDMSQLCGKRVPARGQADVASAGDHMAGLVRFVILGLIWSILSLPIRILALGLIAVLFSMEAAGPEIVPFDIDVALWVQLVSFPGLDYLVAATNWLGQGTLKVAIVVLLVVVPLYLARYRAEALLVLVASMFRMLNSVIKVLLNSPRPTLDLVNVSEEAVGCGYPSGHAMGATLLFGSLVIVIPAIVKQRWLATVLQVLAVLMIVATGFGRIYSGAHWPSDVLGGILIGLLILQPLGWLYHRYRWRIQLHPWFRDNPRRRLPVAESPAPPSGIDASA